MTAELTETADGFVREVAKLEARGPGLPAWAQALRRRGFEQFREAGFPGRDDEAWRFTDLKPLRKIDFGYEPDPGPVLPAGSDLGGLTWLEESPRRVVVVNGFPVAGLSTLSPPDDPCGLETLKGAWDRVEGVLGALVDRERHRFAALNTGFLAGGVRIHIARDCAIRHPLHVLVVGAPGDGPRVTFPRILIEVDAGAEATVVEEYVSLPGEGIGFTDAVTELVVGENAALNHVRLQRESERGFHIGTVAARLGRNARLGSHLVAVGARLSRVDLDVLLAGEGAEATLDGLYLVAGSRHADHHTRVEHRLPHTVSRQLYKGVLDGHGTGVFNGRVVIHPDAQKTEASQTNNNLLLSENALVNTNPELEIFADDVKARHGATVGQIEDEQLFYLRSRGLDQQTARHVLVQAFARDMIDRVPVPAVREALSADVEERF